MPPRRKKLKTEEPAAHDAEAAAAKEISTSVDGPVNVPVKSTATGKRKQAGDADKTAQPEADKQPALRSGRGSGRAHAGPASALVEEELQGSGPGTPNKHKLPHRGHLPNNGRSSTDSIMEACVKVFCTHTEPNFSLPWQRKRQYSSNSSGFIIEGRRILTNAHCVDHHTQVKVKRRGSDVKFVASVLAVGTECDIAMLTVEDDSFWEGVQPVHFGQLPQLQDGVTVVGYPIGGDTMSVTSGVVSRIEVTSYVHGAAELLGIQIDAAINSGNSGGPAFNATGECVGIAFQSLKHEDAENIGYIIPTPVIEHFIHDYERNGKYEGFPCLGIEWQKMESPDMRTALKMQPSQKGVLVRRVEPTSPASKLLRQYDILLSFDGVDIANDGTVPFRSGERISFSYLVSQKYTRDVATLRVLQDGEERTVQVEMKAPVRLIPFHICGKPPSYFIVAGLVFTRVTVPYLRSEYGKEYDFDAPVKLLDKMMHEMAEQPDQQVTVLSQVLASEVNIGYEDIINTQVKALNGQRVMNMKDLVRLVEGCTDEYLHFDLEHNQKVILRTAAAKQATQEILAMHCIASDRSDDLKDVGKSGGS